MGDYSDDRKWSDRFLPAIKQIIGPLLLIESPNEVDCKQAADLITIQDQNVMIACRVRRSTYAKQYGREFTIRSHRDSGQTTELSKIIDGFGDWMFYGYAVDDVTPRINPWVVLDLNVFRADLIRHVWHVRNGLPGIRVKSLDNKDGTV